MPGAVLLYAERTCSAPMRFISSMFFVVMVTRPADPRLAHP
jgi:hypothetical protein